MKGSTPIQQSQTNQWISLGANVGVLVGLLVLIYEINQNRHLVRAELGSEATTIMRELQQDLALDPELSEILAKSSFSQEPLTDAEIIRLDAYYEASIQFLYRERYLIRMGVFEDDPAFLVEVWVRMYLNNPTAIAWWETKKPALPSELIALVDNALSLDSARIEAIQLRQLRERTRAGQ